jgi:hypothetical protein
LCPDLAMPEILPMVSRHRTEAANFKFNESFKNCTFNIHFFS